MAVVAGEARQAVGEIQEPVATVRTNFWGAVQELFSGGQGMTLDDLINRLGSLWEAAQTGLQSLGGQLANMICDFFLRDSAEHDIGEGVGYLVGMFAFQAVLDYFSAGTWTGAMWVVQQIARFLNWPMEALGAVMRMLSSLGRYVVQGVRRLGGLVREAGGALGRVLGAFTTIGERLMAWAERLLGRAAAVEGAGVRAAESAGARTAEGAGLHAAEGAGVQAAEQSGVRAAEGVGEGAASREAGAARREAGAAEREAGAAEREAGAAEREAGAAEREAGAAEREAGAAEREASAVEREAIKAREYPEAVAVARGIVASAQAGQVPGFAVALALDGLKARYTWINHFEDIPHGMTSQILMIASVTHIDDQYRERRLLTEEPASIRRNIGQIEADIAAADAQRTAAMNAGNTRQALEAEERAMQLRRERYLRQCQIDGVPPAERMPMGDWEASARQAHFNAAEGNAMQRQVADELGMIDNNAAGQGTTFRPEGGPNGGTRPDMITGGANGHILDVKTTDGVVYFDSQIRLQAQLASQEGKGLAVVIVSDSPAARPSREFFAEGERIAERLGGQAPPISVVRRAPGPPIRYYNWDPLLNGGEGGWVATARERVAGALGGG
jgi:hypothetical protein